MQRRIASYISRVLVALFLFMSIGPVPDKNQSAYAFDPDNYNVETVTIFKVYDANRYLEERRVLITGHYLKDATVGIITSSGYEELGNRINNTEGLLQFVLDEEQVGSSLVIEGLAIAINEGEMPTLTGVNRKVSVGTDDLYLTGTNLTQVRDIDTISAGYEHEGAYTPMDSTLFTSAASVTIPTPSGSLGLQNIIFEKTESSSYEFQPGVSGDVQVTVKYTYQDQFRFVQDIVIPGLEMYPNRGEAGSQVFFQAPHPNLDSYDVFFLSAVDGTDPYLNSNKGQNRTFQSNVEGMDILTVEVPQIEVGEYYVVLTNAISSGADPAEEVVQELIVGTPDYEKYTVIDANIKSVILTVQPSSGPDTGSEVTVSGQFFGTLNIPEFTPDSDTITTPTPAVSTSELVITYDEGEYKGQRIIQAERKIRVIIGDRAIFQPSADGLSYEVSFNPDLDNLTVRTAQIADAATNPVKDVVVETETTLTREDLTTVIYQERAEMPSSYTYIPSKILPVIESAAPEKIQVIGGAGLYSVPEDRMMAIYGEDFMVSRFVDDEGEEIVRYPVIELGPELLLDKNDDPELELHVFNSNGLEVDGTAGNDTGSKILVTIPGGSTVSTLGKNYLAVTNPVKNSLNPGLRSQCTDFIEFVNPDTSKIPVITQVIPDVVTVDGGEEVVIEGSNFVNGVVVFINGAEVPNINRQGDGKTITFTAPAGQEGETQLQVMNPEGGMDTYPFTYVITYTNPSITSFAPRSGNTGTLVMVGGENFLKPEPTATDTHILRLIGTRVLLEGSEVNTYNRNTATNQIELRDYSVTTQDPLLSIETNEAGGVSIALADYYYAVLLEEEGSPAQHLFMIYKDTAGNIILSDEAGSTYELELDSSGSEILAVQSDGTVSAVTVEAGSLVIDQEDPLQLNMKTLYKVDTENNISGCRVRVMDNGSLIFRVPVLEADGYYDVTVINPDTNKDSCVDQQGFYYFSLPLSKPEITEIEPNEGSVEGGYTITIEGREFEDNGVTKTRVYINGVEVSSQDTVVSTAGDSITLKVPAYPGDLREEKGTDRWTVPVVIVNPDGGTASREEGFTYVIPSSHPQITKIVPATGSGAGNQIVEITGIDFRYFEPFDDDNRNQIWDAEESFNDLNCNERWDSEDDLDDVETDWREPIPVNHQQYEYYYASPILPRIYFGEEQARIVEFSRGYLKVLTPAGAAGSVNVYLVNNDSGMSNSVRYTYEASSPRITSIMPAQGPKQGGQNMEITGSGFSNSEIRIADYDGVADVQIPLIRFGDITNRSIARDQENSGRIDNGIASVTLAGGLTVDYTAGEDLQVTVEEQGEVFTGSFCFDDEVLYINTGSLVSTEEESEYYDGYEMVRISVEDRRLIVERGYSPDVELIRSTQMSLKTPSYYTVGSVTVTLINPDGGEATGSYQYMNPDSVPSITNITRDGKDPAAVTSDGEEIRVCSMDYLSESVITVYGDDFRENACIQVGNILSVAPASISYDIPTRLTFQMPEMSSDVVGELYRVLVINEDGGVASSDQIPGGASSIYLQFTSGETSPQVNGITPSMGPVSGGTVVEISGNDFRSQVDGFDGDLEVYFGDQKAPDDDVSLINYKTLQAVTPAHDSGSVKIKIQNPDGVVTLDEVLFKYISTPLITGIYASDDSDETDDLSSLSILGGQVIKIKGSGFMEGLQVVFSPVVAPAEAESTSPGLVYMVGSEQVNGLTSAVLSPYLLTSGDNGSAVQYIDDETILVTTPAAPVGSGGIMVINPDQGAAPAFDIPYDLPQLEAPENVVAEIIKDEYNDCDRYIKVHWTAVEGAGEYEIHVVKGKDKEFLGSTKLTAFIYQDIKPNTSYKFILTAVGDFGSSPPSMESNRVKTGDDAGAPDLDGGLDENTTMVREQQTVYVSIGRRDNDDSTLIDLSDDVLAGAEEIVISIPARVIGDSSSKPIYIKGEDFSMLFNPAVFQVAPVISNYNNGDAGVKLRIIPSAGEPWLQTGNLLSPVYKIEATCYVGKDTYVLDYLAADYSIIINHDKDKARLRRLQNVKLHRYDELTGQWAPMETEYGVVDSWKQLYRMGTYGILGVRG